jgi:hypothetical protein
MKKYYEAYDDRYRTIHGKGYPWFGSDRTPIVEETARKYGVKTVCRLPADPEWAKAVDAGAVETIDCPDLLPIIDAIVG